MNINRFDGGLSTRLASHLINQNEAVIYDNIDNSRGELYPEASHTDESTSVSPTIINFNGVWESGSASTDFLIFQSNLYKSDGVNKPQKKVGASWLNLGISNGIGSPNNIPLQGGSVDGSYQHCYTYYNSSEGIESNPTAYSPLIKVDGPTEYIFSSDSYTDCTDATEFNGDLYSLSCNVTSKVSVIHKISNGVINTAYSHAGSTSGITGEIIEYNGKLYAGTDDGRLVRSVDGETWTLFQTVGTYIKSFAIYSGTMYILVYDSVSTNYSLYYHHSETNWGLLYVIDTGLLGIPNRIRADDRYFYLLTNTYASYTTDVSVGSYTGFIAGEAWDMVKPTESKWGDIAVFLVGGNVKYWDYSSVTSKTLNLGINRASLVEVDEIIYACNSYDIWRSKVDPLAFYTDFEPWENRGVPGFKLNYQLVSYNNLVHVCREAGSASIIKMTNGKIKVPIVASAEAGVDRIRIYRIGGSLGSMSLVEEINNSTIDYIDDNTDVDIDGSLLTTQNNIASPTGLSYMVSHNAMLFGSVGPKLWYSNVAYPHQWSEFNSINFDDDITGISGSPGGLLVFTEYRTYLVTGSSPSSLSRYLLNGAYGCKSHKSIQSIDNTIIWASSDGICVSNGGSINQISRDKLGYIGYSVISSSVRDGVYYLAYSSGILVADFRFGGIFKNITTTVDGLYSYNNKVYASISGALYSLFTSSSKLSMHYKSGELDEGSISHRKTYKDLYIRTTGAIHLKIYQDGALVYDKDLTAGTNNIKLKKELGYTISFDVTGTGSVQEIEYKVGGRANGD